MEVVQLEMFNIMGKLVAVELELYKQSEKFISEDKEERFQEFIKNKFCSKNDFLNFYKKYPVVARIAVVRIKYLENNFKELLFRLENDFHEICAFLKIKKLHLTNLALSAGDSHEQGSSVAILHFNNIKLVYKPRDLRIGAIFQKFLDWCAVNSGLLDLKIPRGIYRKEYTYTEFIGKTHCKSHEDVSNFYLRYGYLVAVCYLLGINDLHLENVIAMGEYPVIIDIETMFQITPVFKNKNLYTDLLTMINIESVLNTCLLPTKIDVGIDGEIELSALNGKEAKTGSQVLTPVNLNNDDFRYKKTDAYFKGGDNLPMLDNKDEIDYKKYRFRIIEGFNDFMQFLMMNKTEFIYMVSEFKEKRIRVLMKGTERYASMIRYANHPKYNVEMKYRERLMMNIWSYPYADKRIVKSEIKDLLFNDIPIFFTLSNSTDIIDSHGKIYKSFFEKSGLDLAIERIKKFDKKELKQQQMLMIASLGLANDCLNEEKSFVEVKEIKDDFSYLKEAEYLANKLMDESIMKYDTASFMNIDCDTEKHWMIVACDESLYSGLSGISTFFILMYKKTRKKEYHMFYQKLLRLSVIQSNNQLIKSAFTGRLSPIYPMLLEYKIFGTILDEKYLKSIIEYLNELSEEDINNIVGTDYISGLSGIIRLMKNMELISHLGIIHQDTLNLFISILKKRILIMKDTISIQVGLAHGLSGLALALSSASEVDDTLVHDLLTKEMSLDVKEENSYKWCWGLSGMIQARIEIMKKSPNLEIKNQLSVLIEKYENLLDKMPQDDTLCHGLGGILVTLKTIFDYNGCSKWEERIHILLSNIKYNSVVKGYRIPKLYDLEMKGLFDGISGIGLTYLYCLNDIPNLLLLNVK